MSKLKDSIGFGEYSTRGDYHRSPNKKWLYYPIFMEKQNYVKKLCKNLNTEGSKFLDVGCGEGVLVDELSKSGIDISGLDLNYKSKLVKRGSILDIPFKANSLDVVLCLDVLEHIDYNGQKKALSEIKRVLKKGGTAIISLPNIGHIAGRFVFLLGGFSRTAAPERHIGERTYTEWKNLIGEELSVKDSKGLFPTFPLISLYTLASPKASLWLHRLENTLFGGWLQSFCFLSVFTASKN
ncbi:TPA: class I SAM-dependent methyltransferase [archaeon]|nr:class I SAM-dependent methyltransferase [Candidatus Undinarchaeales archaeon SRR5007147.bin71]